MFFVQTLVDFLICSGSGQAVATMPIMVPLADVVGITRQVAVLAFQFGDGITNIIYPTCGVVINGHYDVVPAGEGWQFGPFSEKIIDGKLYGRGASDMNGGIASIIGTLRILSEFEDSLDVGVNVSLVPDEEISLEGKPCYGGLCNNYRTNIAEKHRHRM
ncbi:MAG: succinyl-diaminopimelate desuccinylase [Thermococcaceae archaeon]|nr:succinyl-diaminopimelate desuccinylase [Thermococcaceae archaeon]